MPSFSVAEIARQFLALQDNRLFAIDTPLKGRSELVLTEFEYEESLGQLFELRLELASQDPNIELKQLIGKAVMVTLQYTNALASSEERYFHGYVTDFAHTGTNGGLATYEAIARPWLAFMERRQDIRVFQEESPVDIVTQVTQRYRKFGDIEFRLSQQPPIRSYCTQYKESDLDFVLRLLQAEGLFFHFEHKKDGHALIVTDSSVHAEPISGRSPALRYSVDELLEDEQVVTAFDAQRRLGSNSVALKTKDYKAPGARRATERDADIQQGDVDDYEIYDYLGAHGFPDADRGEQLARFRTEALKAHSKWFEGKSNSRRLAVSRYVQVDDHYNYDVARPEDRQFLLTWVKVTGRNAYQVDTGQSDALLGATCETEFRCIRKAVPFRPLLTIPRPSIIGVQTATVVGPDGMEIYTDELGRVKIQFPWDRIGKNNAGSSCWVRAAHPWASDGFGMVHIPRIGNEVVVVFEDGNPDRPLILSSVYNARNMPPWSLPANATQSGVLTRSSTGGNTETANALRFEDKKGQEEVWLHAEKDQRIEVENDESHSVGNDRHKTVGHDEKASIGNNWTLSTGGIKFETVTLASVQSVGLGKMMNVGLAYNVNVGGLYLRNVVLQMASTVGRDRIDRVVQDWTAHVGHTYEVTVRGKAVGDAVKKDQEKPLDITPDFSPNLPEPVKSADSNQIRITDSGQASLSGASKAQLIGPGGTITIDASGIHLKGKGIYLEGPVTQSGGSAKGLAPVTEADCAECAKKTTSAHPVDVATGQKVLAHDDFVLPGRVPIRWNRRYRSADQRTGNLGVAWKLQYATEVRRDTTGTVPKLIYVDIDGRQLHFPLLEPGEAHFHPIEKITLKRRDANDQTYYEIHFLSGIAEYYGLHPTEPDRWQLYYQETRDKQSLVFSYTAAGNLDTVRNNVHVVECRHDEHGRITDVYLMDAASGHEQRKLAAYQYDEAGNLTRAIDQSNQTWTYRYRNHLLTQYDTPAGATFASEYDGDTPQARVVRTFAYSKLEAVGDDGKPVITRDTRFAYQPEARLSRVTDMLGNTTTYRYNGLWAVDEVVHPDGSTEQIEFDETGNIVAQTDALGRTTRSVVDAQGNPVAIRDAAGHLTRIEYNEQNLPTRITDPAGQIWQREYDAAGHLVKETDPLGNSSSTVYENGLPVAHTDALGNVTKTLFNDAGQLVSRTDCSGFTTQYAYDGLGRLTSQTNALGQQSKTYGNAAGLPTAIALAGLGVWKTEYDKAGQAIAHIDPLGRTTRVTWDAYGKAIGVQSPDGSTTAFGYDTLGRLATLTNAKGENTSFVYDAQGRVIEQTGFDGRRQQVSYNAAGEQVEQIDHGQDGQVGATLLYDSLGRPIARMLGDGARTTFVYDERGLLTQLRHQPSNGEPSQITFEYDAAGRRTAEVQAHHGRVWRLQHRLDAAGNRTDTALPDVGTLTWQRYGSGHIHGVLLNGEPLASFERDALHRTIRNAQGPIAQLFDYTDAGQLKTQRLQDLDERGQERDEPRAWRAWEYDPSGQLTRLSDAWRGDRNYSYDPLARLIGVARQGSGEAKLAVTSETFRYDPAGNLLARMTGGAEHIPPAEFAAIGDRLLRFVDDDGRTRSLFDFTYDGHGNRIGRTMYTEQETPVEKQVSGLMNKLLHRQETESRMDASAPIATRYRYDGAHQLIGIDHADGAKTEYRYDAIGRRIAKVHTPADGQSRATLFVWDGDWMVQEVRAGANARDDEAVTYIPHPDHAGPLAKLESGRRYHYLNDHLGTPQELVDDERKVVWAADLEAYGRTTTEIANEIDNPIRFPGQYRDLESGLYYNRYRYYDPSVGRYINQDLIGLAGGLNKFRYADANPASISDYLGLYTPGKDGVTGVDSDGVPSFDESNPRFHHYFVSNSCKKSNKNCTFKKAAEGLLRYPAPGASGTPITNGQEGFAVPVGYVHHVVKNGGSMVINVTEPGRHLLSPGIVRRWISDDGNSISVNTYGEGTGLFGGLNEVTANDLWTGVDSNIFKYMGCSADQNYAPATPSSNPPYDPFPISPFM
uniref:type VI secretion system tip protein TssI/VgrG n=1 Tax=Burkholderia arboris TaxID=488730 RepID=UPI003BEF4BDB